MSKMSQEFPDTDSTRFVVPHPKPLPVSPDLFSQETTKRAFRKVSVGVVLFVTLTMLSGGAFAYAHYKRLVATSVVSAENKNGGVASSLLQEAQQSPSQNLLATLRRPGDGRVNILFLGIGGVTDSGVVHPGANLTDSIQLLSIDAINKKATFTSLPRDLYYAMPGKGGSKINAVYEFANQAKKDSGGEAIKDAVSTVFGVTVHNFVMLDFSAAEEIIDEVGGIDITVPKTLYDPTFPDERTTGYDPLYIKAGPQHMDGNTALRYMRSRHADSDYGRSERQQAVMLALRDKILSGGVLGNPVKLSQVLLSLGNHLRTDLQPQEAYQIFSSYKDIPQSSITTSVLDTSPELNLLYSANDPVAGSIALPKQGSFAYGAIHQWFHAKNPDPYLAKEAPTVFVTNAGATEKQLKEYIEKLRSYGYTVVTKPGSSTVKNTVTKYYVKRTGKSVSFQYLTTLLPEGAVASTNSMYSDQDEDFQILLGGSK